MLSAGDLLLPWIAAFTAGGIIILVIILVALVAKAIHKVRVLIRAHSIHRYMLDGPWEGMP